MSEKVSSVIDTTMPICTFNRAAEVEKASARFMDVPVHLYRQAGVNGLKWVAEMVQGKRREETDAGRLMLEPTKRTRSGVQD